VLHAKDTQRAELAEGLNALRDDRGADFISEGKQRCREGAPKRVGVDVAGQRYIELDDVGSKIEDVPEA